MVTKAFLLIALKRRRNSKSACNSTDRQIDRQTDRGRERDSELTMKNRILRGEMQRGSREATVPGTRRSRRGVCVCAFTPSSWTQNRASPLSRKHRANTNEERENEGRQKGKRSVKGSQTQQLAHSVRPRKRVEMCTSSSPQPLSSSSSSSFDA